MYTLLQTAKHHLYIDKDFHDDDEYIIRLIQVAEDAIAKRIDVPDLDAIVDRKTGYLPQTVQQAILLLVGNYYANRETTTFAQSYELNKGFDYLADLNKHYFIP